MGLKERELSMFLRKFQGPFWPREESGWFQRQGGARRQGRRAEAPTVGPANSLFDLTGTVALHMVGRGFRQHQGQLILWRVFDIPLQFNFDLLASEIWVKRCQSRNSSFGKTEILRVHFEADRAITGRRRSRDG